METQLEGIILGIGNPLLDISAHVSEDILKKYDLKMGNAILAEPKHLPLYEELVKNYKVDYTAGGAAQNTIRAAQWMIQVPKATGYIGGVGNDDLGKKLKEAAESDGVTTHYLVTDKKPTGSCAVCVVQRERSLCANLGAAECYQKSHFESAEIQAVVKKAKFFYATGFVLTHSADTLVALGEHVASNNKQLLFNLAAPFIIEFFWDKVASVLPFVDIVICNEDEAEALGKKQNWGNDLKEIAKKLAETPKKNTSRSRTVIFTRGAKETLVYTGGKSLSFIPLKIPKEEIVDTNGAGDSFVGGFMSQYVQNKPLEVCIKAGHYCASEVIKRSGCTFPPKPQFKP
jgi:adenosine kinase